MIQDKDYMVRLVRQFSGFLAKLILGKNEGDPIEEERIFDTQLRDIFKTDFDQLSTKTFDELKAFVEEKENFHSDYYEMLGNLFYYKGKILNQNDLLTKAKSFYELYLQTSGVFALPIINRISEINKIQ